MSAVTYSVTVLSAFQHESEEDSDDRPIWDRARSKRRRTGFLQLSKVARIFPNMEPKLLCQLAEMVSVTPLEVLSLIPEATTEQLCKFFDMIEKSKQAPKRDSRREVLQEKSEAKPAKSLLDQLRQLDDER